MEKILFLNPPIIDSKKAFNRPIRFPTFSYATYTIHPPARELLYKYKYFDPILKNPFTFILVRRIFDYPNLSSQDLKKAVKYAYRTYYFRPQLLYFAFRRLLQGPKEFIYNLKQFFKLLFS